MRVTSNDVEVCRRAPARGQSCTGELLRVWGSRGFTVDHLYVLLAKLGQKRAMILINDYGRERFFLDETVQPTQTEIVKLDSQTSGSTQSLEKFKKSFSRIIFYTYAVPLGHD